MFALHMRAWVQRLHVAAASDTKCNGDLAGMCVHRIRSDSMVRRRKDELGRTRTHHDTDNARARRIHRDHSRHSQLERTLRSDHADTHQNHTLLVLVDEGSHCSRIRTLLYRLAPDRAPMVFSETNLPRSADVYMEPTLWQLYSTLVLLRYRASEKRSLKSRALAESPFARQ